MDALFSSLHDTLTTGVLADVLTVVAWVVSSYLILIGLDKIFDVFATMQAHNGYGTEGEPEDEE